MLQKGNFQLRAQFCYWVIKSTITFLHLCDQRVLKAQLKSFFIAGGYADAIGFEVVNITVNNNVNGLLACLQLIR